MNGSKDRRTKEPSQLLGGGEGRRVRMRGIIGREGRGGETEMRGGAGSGRGGDERERGRGRE